MRCTVAILAAMFLITASSAQEKDKPPMPDMQMPKTTPKTAPKAAPKAAPKTAPKPSRAPQGKPLRVSQGTTTLADLVDKSKWPEPVADDLRYSYALFDLLEYRRVNSVNAMRWDVFGWRGGDMRRFSLKSEGTYYPDTRTGNADVQALYGRMIAPFFELQVGARVERRDETDAPTRVFAVVGLQGLAPGRFEIEPALFLSNQGKVSGRFTVSADILQTQRLILQPRFETEVAVQRDDAFDVERGISDVELGLRLRYEIYREFAPYVGVSYRQSQGATRSRVIREGGAASELQIAVGVRTWR